MAIYATYEVLKAEINLLDTDESNRGTTERLLASASAAIDRFCNRPLGFLADTEATAKVYPGSGYPYQLIDECTAVTLVEVKDSVSDAAYTAWLPTDWVACTGDYHYPDYGQARWMAPTVQVTASWGYAVVVPDQIKTATIMQTARWFKRLQGSMSDALASGELGQLLFLQKLDPDIAMILKDGRFMHPATGRW